MNISEFRKNTQYDVEKEKKKNNYTYLNEHYCKTNQVVLAGDSITELFNPELFDFYVSESGLKVYSRGISGDTSDRMLERFDENVLNLNPAYLVILIGTNDLSQCADVDFIANNIRQMVLSAQEKSGAKICVQSVYPVGYDQKEKNAEILKLNELIRKLTEELGVYYLDVHSLLCDENGGFKDEYTYDGLHPNVVGFEVVSKEIINRFLK